MLKHLSHHVRPGAHRLATSSQFANLLAFQNFDKRVLLVAQNNGSTARTVCLRVGARTVSPALKPNSVNTFVLKQFLQLSD